MDRTEPAPQNESKACKILKGNSNRQKGVLPPYLTNNSNWDDPKLLAAYQDYYRQNVKDLSRLNSRYVSNGLLAISAIPAVRAIKAGAETTYGVFGFIAGGVGSNEAGSFLDSSIRWNEAAVRALDARLDQLAGGC